MENVIVRLRFIGRPEGGKLVRGAPGNYQQGEVTSGPLVWVKLFPRVWELVDSIPELRVPDASEGDSVYEDAIFVPDDDEAEIVFPTEPQTPKTKDAGITLSGSTETELDAHTKEVIEGYKKQGMYLLDADEGIMVSSDEPVEKDPRSRDELKDILDKAGVKYSVKSRTETLARMVQTLESKEDS